MPSPAFLKIKDHRSPRTCAKTSKRLPALGGTPLVVAENSTALGVIYLKDIVKGGLKERLARLRAMGIRTIMITGDNPLTAAVIAREAGVDDFLAEAKPKDKMDLIKREQGKGKLVAMTGDGTNDAPALAQADVGVAMNSGTQAAKEAGNMVDLDSNPTKLIEIVEIGKQLLMTRGALTTFSIANDVAKYFAIIPAMFAGAFPVLNALNIMYLHSPQSAILSAVVFNAIIIVALIPLALKGVKYRTQSRRSAATAKPAHLWRRWRHRAVHRHQGHRHAARRHAPGMKSMRNFNQFDCVEARLHSLLDNSTNPLFCNKGMASARPQMQQLESRASAPVQSFVQDFNFSGSCSVVQEARPVSGHDFSRAVRPQLEAGL